MERVFLIASLILLANAAPAPEADFENAQVSIGGKISQN